MLLNESNFLQKNISMSEVFKFFTVLRPSKKTYVIFKSGLVIIRKI